MPPERFTTICFIPGTFIERSERYFSAVSRFFRPEMKPSFVSFFMQESEVLNITVLCRICLADVLKPEHAGSLLSAAYSTGVKVPDASSTVTTASPVALSMKLQRPGVVNSLLVSMFFRPVIVTVSPSRT